MMMIMNILTKIRSSLKPGKLYVLKEDAIMAWRGHEEKYGWVSMAEVLKKGEVVLFLGQCKNEELINNSPENRNIFLWKERKIALREFPVSALLNAFTDRKSRDSRIAEYLEEVTKDGS